MHTRKQPLSVDFLAPSSTPRFSSGGNSKLEKKTKWIITPRLCWLSSPKNLLYSFHSEKKPRNNSWLLDLHMDVFFLALITHKKQVLRSHHPYYKKILNKKLRLTNSPELGASPSSAHGTSPSLATYDQRLTFKINSWFCFSLPSSHNPTKVLFGHGNHRIKLDILCQLYRQLKSKDDLTLPLLSLWCTIMPSTINAIGSMLGNMMCSSSSMPQRSYVNRILKVLVFHWSLC